MLHLNDNKLKKVHDQKMIGHHLLSAKEKNEEVFVWRIIGDKKIVSPIKIEIVQKAKSEILISPIEGTGSEFNNVVGGLDHLNFYLPKSSLLFQCNIKNSQQNKLSVSFPKFVAQVERRKWLRMTAINDSKIRIQFCKSIAGNQPSKQFFGKGLFDLSAGGLTFLATKAESKLFIPGEKLKNIELIINNQKMIVSTNVLRVNEFNSIEASNQPYKMWKVTLSFDSIQKKDLDFLIKFVFEHVQIDEKAV